MSGSSSDILSTAMTKLGAYFGVDVNGTVQKIKNELQTDYNMAKQNLPHPPQNVNRPKMADRPTDVPPRRSAPAFSQNEYGYSETYFRDRLKKHLESMETLHQSGLLTDQEFRERKRKVMKLL